MIKKMKFLTVVFFLLLATAVNAQMTTSSMSGRVTDNEGLLSGRQWLPHILLREPRMGLSLT